MQKLNSYNHANGNIVEENLGSNDKQVQDLVVNLFKVSSTFITYLRERENIKGVDFYMQDTD